MIAKLKEQIAEIDESIRMERGNIQPHRAAIDAIERRIDTMVVKRNLIKGKMTEAKKKPRVSDHAVIRLLERRHGFNFEDIRKSMLTPAVVAAMELGAESVKAEGGHYKLAGKTIVTFSPKGRKKSPPKSPRKLTDAQAIKQSMDDAE